MKMFQKLSIRNKLIGIMVLVTFLASAIGSILLILNQYSNLKESAINDALSNANFISKFSTLPLAFNMPESADQVIKEYKHEPGILNIIVYDTNANVFSFFSKGADNPPEIKHSKFTNDTVIDFSGKYIDITLPVRDKDISYGYVFLRTSSEELFYEINYYIRITLLILMLILIVAFILAHFLQRIISKPILELADITKRVYFENDYSIRAQKKSYDETGALYDGFNKMLESIEQRQMERDKAVAISEALNKELNDKNKELEQIIYVTSHDLRSPLVNIQGFSKEIEYSIKDLKEKLDNLEMPEETHKDIDFIFHDEIKTSIDFVLAGINKMDVLLKGLLQLSRLGRAALNIDKINMNSLVNEVEQAHKYQILEKKCDVVIDKLPDCFGDYNQINIIFSNLVGNAIKYLEPGRQGLIHISAQENGENVIYAIKDNGIGIKDEYKDKIFEIFYRLDPDSTTGEGLGLTIVSKIIERQKGSVWLESEKGKGSTFFVSLPNYKYTV